jgi:hypothetical protein
MRVEETAERRRGKSGKGVGGLGVVLQEGRESVGARLDFVRQEAGCELVEERDWARKEGQASKLS